MKPRPLEPHPQRDELPADASLPEQAPPPAARHPAANLELVGRCGTSLLVGVSLGLLLLDLWSWRAGAGFTGQSLVAGGALGITVLPVGALAWVAGWRLRRARQEPPVLSPEATRRLSLLCLLAGAALALLLGLPT